ncbi:metallophosphoesterase [Fictibacillus macauensis ZFHKF-1]|uniref:Metallophosphoesterase n=1 Tax=Fictibacillus macauensis ZFHKF-1 TaxID=1196324 RepID=I8UGW7_9BACL|nr:metallophosphoesterase family protein [Fictibacillus macauensis]EIT86048.1 metallophosphoesterase [Fictibacillus macauensis ZFHKF-1]
MSRTIVMSDIHGHYEPLMALLSDVKYGSGDKLIFLGDYVDRGPDAARVVATVKNLVETENAVALAGNHENLFLKWLWRMEDRKRYLQIDGGKKTVKSFCKPYGISSYKVQAKKCIFKNYRDEITFLKNLPLYYEDERHLFVHAGINPELDDWRQTSKRDFRWIRSAFWEKPQKTGKIIIHGHTPTVILHKDHYDVWLNNDNQEINIDGGCHYGGWLHALVIEGNDYTAYSIDHTCSKRQVKKVPLTAV